MTDAHGCPSEFGLERLRLAELAEPDAEVLTAHVQGCAACSRRLADLAAAPAPFDLDGVWRAARLDSAPTAAGPSWIRRLAARWLLPLAGTAAVATAVLVLGSALRRSGPADLVKGSGDIWNLGVIVKRRGQPTVQRAASGVRLSAGDQLRFEVTTKSVSGYAAVIGADSRGTVTPLAPANGDAILVRGGRPVVLDGAIELDDAPGTERLHLFGCARPIAVAELVRAVRQASTADCHHETMWIEKVKP